MGLISNRFFVTALDDGTTLHGNLSVDGSLSQAWNPATQAAVPSWATTGTTGTKDQPTIMLTLLNGNVYIGIDSTSANGYISEAKWYYNNHGQDDELTFSDTDTTITYDGGSVTGKLSTGAYAGLFLKFNKTYNGVTVPALRIVQNLAGSSNADLDTITFKGKYRVSASGAELDFQATAQVRIGVIGSSGYWGVINFANGVSNITDQSQVITMTAVLYGSQSSDPVTGAKTEWKMNGTTIQAKSTTATCSVSGADVVDSAIIECNFYVTTDGVEENVATAYASIDDMQDNEFMYIQYNGANGNAASLRKGGNPATFDIWIGKTNDPTVDQSYAYFQVKLLNGSGAVITTDYTSQGIANPDANGWRNLQVSNVTHKASLSITYDIVAANQKNITGLLRASTAQFT